MASLTPLALFLARVLLGVHFILAGWGKIAKGVEGFYEGAFLSMKPAWLPLIVAKPYGYSIPFLEVLVGVLLVIGFFSRLTATLAALMVISFTIALAGVGKLGTGVHANAWIILLLVVLAGQTLWGVDSYLGATKRTSDSK